MPLNLVAKAAIAVGMQAAQMAVTMSRKIEGQRLDDLKFTQGDYNAPLPLVWGTRRIQGNIFWAEELTEVRRRRKTKGGKFNDYTYFGTWAVAVAGHEIGAVTRIWADTHLIYDATGAGPLMPFGFGDARPGTAGNDIITVYTGTETQDADPRMKATVEAQSGVGSCPAYRGTAYVMFKDIPLEKFGNRIPQMSLEVVGAESPAFPFEQFSLGLANARMWNTMLSPDGTLLYLAAGGTSLEVWDLPSRTQITDAALPNQIRTAEESLGVYESGNWLAVASNREDLLTYSPSGQLLATQENIFPGILFDQRWQQSVFVRKDGTGTEHWLSVPWSNVEYYFIDGVEFSAAGWKPWCWFADLDGNIWGAGANIAGGTTSVQFRKVITATGFVGPSYETITVTGLSASSGTLDGKVYAYSYRDGGNDYFVMAWRENSIHIINAADGAIVASNTTTALDVFSTAKQFNNARPGDESVWVGTGTTTATEISSRDASIIRTVTLANWINQDADGFIYSHLLNALLCFPSGGGFTIRYLDRGSGEGVTLGSIVSDLAEQVGVTDYDFTGLNQIVAGWSAVRGGASQMIEPLLDVYDSDIAAVDFGVTGRRRTGVSGGTLATPWFVPDSDRFTVKVRQGTELPRSLTIAFADLDAEQQPNNVRSDRPLDATGSRGEGTIDMGTLALAPDDARALADRHFARIWNSSRTADLVLTRQQLGLTPGDVRALTLDGEEWEARLTNMVIRADGTISTSWVYDAPALAELDDAAGAGADGHLPSVIAFPVPTQGFVVDIPLVSDADDGSLPVAYAAAAPFGSGSWGGAIIYRDSSAGGDGEFDEDFASFPATAAASWGRTTNALGAAAPTVWDRGNVLNVVMNFGTLSSATEDAIDADPRLNLLLIGGELVQYATANLQVDGSYNLSGFKRGRRGTEFAVSGHAAGETVLVMGGAVAERYEIADVGTSSRFQSVTFGRGDGFVQTVALEGASLKPYAPANVTAERNADGDWTFAWDRRTRIGAGWGVNEVPLGEATEVYELVLGDGVESVSKTATSASFTWTAAAQTTDLGAPVAAGDLAFTIYQMSATVGRGFPASGIA